LPHLTSKPTSPEQKRAMLLLTEWHDERNDDVGRIPKEAASMRFINTLAGWQKM
jgi:hypothetical protein